MLSDPTEPIAPDRWREESVLCRERLRNASGQDDNFAKVLLDAFFATLPTRLRLIKSALRKGDLDAMRYHAHAAAGSSQAIGAAKIAKMCLALEKDLEAEEARPVVTQLAKELREFMMVVQAEGLYPPKKD